jgi:hypothetical protein
MQVKKKDVDGRDKPGHDALFVEKPYFTGQTERISQRDVNHIQRAGPAVSSVHQNALSA